jgi:hypothetical protein
LGTSDIFHDDVNVVSYALSMWANYIETGDVTLSKQDCENCGYYADRIKRLDNDQAFFVAKLRHLSMKKWVTLEERRE